MTILQATQDPNLFQPWFQDGNWNNWKAFLAGLFGLPMGPKRAKRYRKHTARRTLPTHPAREAWVVAGRRGGKSRIAALVAVFLACFHDYTPYLAPGEVATIVVIAADRRQSRTIMRYITGFLDNIPMLAAMVVSRARESIEFNNRTLIEIHTCSFRAVRGYTIAAAICDEIAFWRNDENSANPDTEVITALRPAMATIPNSLLLCISSPYAKRGALFNAHKKHYGKDSPTLVWQATTREMNPTVDASLIEQAYADDPAAAAAEYGAAFRSDIESFVSREVVESCVGDFVERAYDSQFAYRAFVDAAGGSGQDSFTLAVAHAEKDVTVIDVIKETRPPFNPEATTDYYCEVLGNYRIQSVRGDKYAGDWPSEQFAKRGVRYTPAERSKSELYRDVLPLLNSGKVVLPKNPKLVSQLCNLERRTGRGTGRDVIDHPPGSHDDLANVCAGVCVGAPSKKLARRLV
ncbi:MAG: hypothetical protein JXR49_09485 [Acidobacteria bacterium]|nr:hypothetical protein [Acidobacteriota bacterium]